jgi:acyl carrier protein
MEKREIEAKAYNVMSRFNKEDFDYQDDFVSFVNSLQALEARLELEKTFGIKISDAEAASLTSVSKITRFVESKLG